MDRGAGIPDASRKIGRKLMGIPNVGTIIFQVSNDRKGVVDAVEGNTFSVLWEGGFRDRL